eukprot:scaffold7453_cov128-Isochrysis_galbana.AAC.15
MKARMVAVRRPPRLAGERKPSIAHRMETADMASNCMPVPSEAHSRIALGGGRNTSACTSFHPDSSASSSLSWSLYLEHTERRSVGCTGFDSAIPTGQAGAWRSRLGAAGQVSRRSVMC